MGAVGFRVEQALREAFVVAYVSSDGSANSPTPSSRIYAAQAYVLVSFVATKTRDREPRLWFTLAHFSLTFCNALPQKTIL